MSTATVDLRSLAYPVLGSSSATYPISAASSGKSWRKSRRVRTLTSSSSFNEPVVKTEQEEIPSWSFRLTAEGVNRTLRSVEALQYDLDEDDGYPTVPSDYATTLVLDIVKRAGALIEKDVPPGSACPDVNGGIRVTWRRPSREVRFVVPGDANGRSYVYVQAGSRSVISDDISADALAAHLSWLNEE